MPSFIRITHIYDDKQLRALINVDTIDAIGDDYATGKLVLMQKDGTKWVLATGFEECWAQLKPNVIFS